MGIRIGDEIEKVNDKSVRYSTHAQIVTTIHEVRTSLYDEIRCLSLYLMFYLLYLMQKLNHTEKNGFNKV